MKLIIGIPTLNRADLLNEALIKYFEDFENTEIFIVDNGNQSIITREEKFAIYRPTENLGVAKSWNYIMDYADKVEATHVLMMNDDVYLGRTEHEIKMVMRNNENFDFINSFLNWCSYILKVEAWKKAGKFDEEFFPAYFEDNSFDYKMTLIGAKKTWTSFLDPIVYRNSMTIAKDPALNNRFEYNKQLYIRMWGGIPTEEKYVTKFNQ
jgi:glycosyltransferase involved in cell wall biosynthesis